MQLDGRVAIKVNEKIVDKCLVDFEYLTYIIKLTVARVALPCP